MKLSTIIGIIFGLILIGLISWLLYRFIYKKSDNEQTPPTEDKNNPPIKSDSLSGGKVNKKKKDKQTNAQTSEDEEKNKKKWEDFKYTNKANRIKINNDIIISEENQFNNPDFSEIFKQPAATDKSIFNKDVIDSKVNISNIQKNSYESYMNVDTSTIDSMTEEYVDINQLDDIQNISAIKNIEQQLTESSSNDTLINEVKLIDNEVFGY